MNKVEKIVLTIFAIEHLGFGLYGLYDPYSIAELTGYILNSEFALSEIRAYYTLISALGFMGLFAIFIQSISDIGFICKWAFCKTGLLDFMVIICFEQL